MLSLTALRTEVQEDLGATLVSLYPNINSLCERWLNRGQMRLDWQIRESATISWAAGATTINLPADFSRWGRFVSGTDGVELPSGHEIGLVYEIHRPQGALSAGSGKLIYWADPPTITTSQASLLPRIGDVAIIAFSIYSFYNKLGSSRADYEKYSVLVGQNGVDLEEIRTLSRDAYDEFIEAKNQLPRKPSVSYYGD
jgi:hypothetical protein